MNYCRLNQQDVGHVLFDVYQENPPWLPCDRPIKRGNEAQRMLYQGKGLLSRQSVSSLMQVIYPHAAEMNVCDGERLLVLLYFKINFQ